MKRTKTAIFDLSAIYWRNWHASKNEEQSSAKQKTLAYIRERYSSFDKMCVALDSPPYERKDIFPAYKANREEKPKAATEELRNTIESLRNDGHYILSCKGQEEEAVSKPKKWDYLNVHQGISNIQFRSSGLYRFRANLLKSEPF